MSARPSQIRAHRILSGLAILHSAVVLGLRFGNYAWSWLWLGLATSLFLWPILLALHPGRSIPRFLLPAIVAAALFVPCAAEYGVRVHYSVGQWLAANNLEKLLQANPRIILYSIDAAAETDAGSTEFDREPYKAPAVLGYVEITDNAEQRALITALARSARYARGGGMCHIPRHGLYVETGASTVNLSICFACQNVYSFGSHNKTGPLAAEDSFEITDAPASVFNATLKRHGVPIRKSPSP
jgi:hypothetical protein